MTPARLGVLSSPYMGLSVGQAAAGVYIRAGATFNVSAADPRQELGVLVAGEEPGPVVQETYLRAWHHIVLLALPWDQHLGSMKVWFDGRGGTPWCRSLSTNGLGVSDLAAAPESAWVPPAVSRGCDMSKPVDFPPKTATRLRRNASETVLSLSSQTWFRDPGEPALDSGGSTATLSMRTTDAPFTVASRLVAGEASPAAALLAMPPVAGAAWSCSLAPADIRAFAGRSVCTARCVDPTLVVAADLTALCAAPGPWSAVRRDVDGADGLCDPAAAGPLSGAGDVPDSGVWTDQSGRRLLAVPAVSWPSPIGWSGLVGAAGRANETPWDDASMEAWGRDINWSTIFGPGGVPAAAADAGAAAPAWEALRTPAGRRRAASPTPATPGTGDGSPAPLLGCAPPGPVVTQRWRVPQSVVVRVCLGGFALREDFREPALVLRNSVRLSSLSTVIRRQVATVLGVPELEQRRIIVPRAGIVSAETAAAIGRAAGLPDTGNAAQIDAMCSSPARSALLRAFGSNATAGCLCAHVVFLATASPASVSRSARSDAPASLSASALAASFASAVALAPTLTLPLTTLTGVSPGGTAVMPLYSCSSEESSGYGLNAGGAGLPPEVLAALEGISTEVGAGIGISAGSRAPSLIPCAWMVTAGVARAAGPPLAALVAYACLALWYVLANGSVAAAPKRIQPTGSAAASLMRSVSGGSALGVWGPRGAAQADLVSPSSTREAAALTELEAGGPDLPLEGWSTAAAASCCLPLAGLCWCLRLPVPRRCGLRCCCARKPVRVMTTEQRPAPPPARVQRPSSSESVSGGRFDVTSLNDLTDLPPATAAAAARDSIGSTDRGLGGASPSGLGIRGIEGLREVAMVSSLTTESSGMTGQGPSGASDLTGLSELSDDTTATEAMARARRGGSPSPPAHESLGSACLRAAPVHPRFADAVVTVVSVGTVVAQAVCVGVIADSGLVAWAVALGAIMACPMLVRAVLTASGLCGFASLPCFRHPRVGRFPVIVGVAHVASLTARDGGVFGRQFVRVRSAAAPGVGLSLLASVVDLRASRILASGLCTGAVGSPWSMHGRASARRGLACVDAVVAVPCLLAWAAAAIGASAAADGPACLSLTDETVRAMFADEAASSGCEASLACVTWGCLVNGEGAFMIGLPVLASVVWSVAAAWARLGSVIAVCMQSAGDSAWAEDLQSGRRARRPSRRRPSAAQTAGARPADTERRSRAGGTRGVVVSPD